MRTDGIEIPQQYRRPLRIGDTEILEDALDHEFGAAVRVGYRAGGHILPQGEGLFIPYTVAEELNTIRLQPASAMT